MSDVIVNYRFLFVELASTSLGLYTLVLVTLTLSLSTYNCNTVTQTTKSVNSVRLIKTGIRIANSNSNSVLF